MNALTFNNVKLTPVSQNDNQVWITSKDLANALGYARADSVSRIYDRNSDEFTEDMTLNVNLTVSNKNNELEHTQARIFSLRGCHLVAMFARTKVAKEFRKWVLDVLASLKKTTAKQREVFITACDKLAINNTLRSDVYKSVANHFGYDKPVNMPVDILPQAIAYVYEELLAQEKAKNSKPTDKEYLHSMSKRGYDHVNENCRLIREVEDLLFKIRRNNAKAHGSFETLVIHNI